MRRANLSGETEGDSGMQSEAINKGWPGKLAASRCPKRLSPSDFSALCLALPLSLSPMIVSIEFRETISFAKDGQFCI